MLTSVYAGCKMGDVNIDNHRNSVGSRSARDVTYRTGGRPVTSTAHAPTDTAGASSPVGATVAVIGAGPIGLAAAAHLLERALEPVVFERGDRAGASVASWGHVRLFSRWSELIDPAARRLLAGRGWVEPDPNRCPTGAEWAQENLQPLAEALGDRIRYETTVTGVARQGRDRVVDSGREDQPFTVHVRHEDGRTGRVTAGAVADVSTADDVARFGGRRTAVVGSGHSALTALVALATLAEKAPGTIAVWVLRRGAVGSAYGGGDADQLPARGALGLRARDAVATGHIEVVTGFRTQALEHVAGGALALVSEDGRRVDGLDEVVGLTGFRPDHSIMSELRLRLDDRLEAPRGLAPLIDPNVHSCGTVYPHGAGELAHDEQGVYVVGMKAYGRAPTFLALTGYEQVRSVAAALAGDHEAASRVELALPETGVCGGAGLFDEPAAATAGADGEEAVGGCCAPAVPQLVQIGAPSGSGGACGPTGC